MCRSYSIVSNDYYGDYCSYITIGTIIPVIKASGSLTDVPLPLVADCGTMTDDIVAREEERMEAANYGRFLTSRFITRSVLRRAMNATGSEKMAVCRQYSRFLHAFEALKTSEASLLTACYPEALPPKIDGGAATFVGQRETNRFYLLVLRGE